MVPAPPPSRSAGKSAALAVGLGVGFAAMTGVVVGALYGANALSTTAASRQASKPALQEDDLLRDEAGRILNWRTALRIIQHGVSELLGECCGIASGRTRPLGFAGAGARIARGQWGFPGSRAPALC